MKKNLLTIALIALSFSVSATNLSLSGTYAFKEPKVEYRGADMLLAMAVTGFKEQINILYLQNGLDKNRAYIQFKSKNRFTSWVVDKEGNKGIDGTYTIAPDGKNIDFTWADKKKKYTIRGEITSAQNPSGNPSNTGFVIMFDASRAAQTAKTISPELAKDEQFTTIATLLENMPGLWLGAVFAK